jgi:hypothetical protein
MKESSQILPQTGNTEWWLKLLNLKPFAWIRITGNSRILLWVWWGWNCTQSLFLITNSWRDENHDNSEVSQKSHSGTSSGLETFCWNGNIFPVIKVDGWKQKSVSSHSIVDIISGVP